MLKDVYLLNKCIIRTIRDRTVFTSIGKFHKVHFGNGWFGENSVSYVDGINVKQKTKTPHVFFLLFFVHLVTSGKANDNESPSSPPFLPSAHQFTFSAQHCQTRYKIKAERQIFRRKTIVNVNPRTEECNWRCAQIFNKIRKL